MWDESRSESKSDTGNPIMLKVYSVNTVVIVVVVIQYRTKPLECLLDGPRGSPLHSIRPLAVALMPAG